MRYNKYIVAKLRWTAQLESSIIEAIQSGATLRKIGLENGFSASCIVDRADRNPEFGKRYARALQIRADLDLDEIDALTSAPPERGKFGIDPGWANWQRTRIDAKKWLASKRNPKKYGDKHEITGKDGAPFIPLTLADFYGGRLLGEGKRSE
jgi:hypothetical protein